MTEQEQPLVTIVPINDTSALAIEFSPSIMFADYLFEDTERLLIIYDEGEPEEERLFLSKEEFQQFIQDHSMLPLLKEKASEDYFLSLVQFAWNMILKTLESALAQDYRLMMDLYDGYHTGFYEEMKRSARLLIEEKCLPRIEKKAQQLTCDQKWNGRGKEPTSYT
ncbi:MAG: hypothetical protein GF308_21940 [Candidatus Heimdallarchaeota archaeon]|nr:hypothetical protein [Candidatus Heimdallarchaeota archaeon]